MKDRTILDSSIWIELERQNKKIMERINPLIQKNRICLVDVIVAEVLRGTKTKKDFQLLKEAFSNFRWLSTRWDKVAELAFQAAKRGYQPPLVALYIAQAVLENRCVLITQDKHFSQIAKVSPLKIVLLER